MAEAPVTMSEVRNALAAQPFVPFTVRTTDGRAYHVPHPDFAAVPPKAERTFIVFTGEDEGHAVADLLLVSALEFGKPEPRQGRNGAA